VVFEQVLKNCVGVICSGSVASEGVAANLADLLSVVIGCVACRQSWIKLCKLRKVAPPLAAILSYECSGVWVMRWAAK
jgi:hypothetical protein